MALNKALLKTEIIAEMEGLGFNTGNGFSKMPQLAEAIANAVVAHITTNAEVATTSGAPDSEHAGIIS